MTTLVRCISVTPGESHSGDATDMTKYLELGRTYRVRWRGEFDPGDGRIKYFGYRLEGVERVGDVPFHEKRFERVN